MELSERCPESQAYFDPNPYFDANPCPYPDTNPNINPPVTR